MQTQTQTKQPFSELSKKVGFNYGPASFPKNMSEVKKANEEQILRWFRFCPTPKTLKQVELINAVTARFKLIDKE